MSNLTRFDPFYEMSRIDPFTDVGELFKSMLSRPAWRMQEPEPLMRLDVTEQEREYLVHAEIPGVKKDDIHISIDGARVSISAEVKREEEHKGLRSIRRECYAGKVSRSFMLDAEVDAAEATAKYENGILDLHLPKKAGSRVKELKVV
jgi:HSP20 family protein